MSIDDRTSQTVLNKLVSDSGRYIIRLNLYQRYQRFSSEDEFFSMIWLFLAEYFFVLFFNVTRARETSTNINNQIHQQAKV